ncbi:MAG: hypothetical protein QW800_07110, partial [Candidatus Bathyarchaeia archaeon]
TTIMSNIACIFVRAFLGDKRSPKDTLMLSTIFALFSYRFQDVIGICGLPLFRKIFKGRGDFTTGWFACLFNLKSWMS